VKCIPLNDLPRITQAHSGYVVVGSGKTGIDACLWLLENGVAPEKIRWIMPRDAWYLDRVNTQSGPDSLATLLKSVGDQMEAAAAANSVDDVLARLESSGQLLRIDSNVKPTMYRCATVTRAELAELRRIKNIVRLGRVQRIDADKIVLERGSIPSDPNWLYVNCSAKAFEQAPAVPIFSRDTITLQCVRTCQPIFSSALIAHVEAKFDSDVQKNQLCGVVPLPEKPVDWLSMLAASMSNQYQWSQHEDLRKWLLESRLDGLSAAFQNVKETDVETFALLQRYRSKVGPAAANLKQLLA
jgi:hypothetical protein